MARRCLHTCADWCRSDLLWKGAFAELWINSLIGFVPVLIRGHAASPKNLGLS